MHGPLYHRHSEKDKSQALKMTKGNFDAPMILSNHAKSELQWRRANVEKCVQFNTSSTATPTNNYRCFPSRMGNESSGVSSGGNWYHSESKHHINYLEMLAVLLGLQNFAKNNNNTHIRIMCDNTTTVNVINHMGTSHSDLCYSVANKIWDWCITCKIWLSAAHIPGKQNVN